MRPQSSVGEVCSGQGTQSPATSTPPQSVTFRPTTPRASGTTGQGLCVLHEPPHPANYTQPSSSNPRPSCIAPRRCRDPLGRPHPRTNKPSAAELLPRARVSYQVPERRSCRLTPDMVIRGWRPDARWRLHWPEAGRPSSGQISSSAAFWCDSGGEVSSSWWPTTSTTD